MIKYSAARPQIKTGDMLLWSAKAERLTKHDIETNMVKLGTLSQWTHVGVAWADHGRLFVMDMTKRGCAPRPLGADLPCWWIPASQELSEEALQWAFSRFGEMVYPSNWEAFKAWLLRLTRLDDMKGQCSEYALGIYEAAGYAVTHDVTPYGCMMWAMQNWGATSLNLIVPD